MLLFLERLIRKHFKVIYTHMCMNCMDNHEHLDASLVASQFYHLIGAIGVRISSLPGAVRQLGKWIICLI